MRPKYSRIFEAFPEGDAGGTGVATMAKRESGKRLVMAGESPEELTAVSRGGLMSGSRP